jgi:hypothetical protein
LGTEETWRRNLGKKETRKKLGEETWKKLGDKKLGKTWGQTGRSPIGKGVSGAIEGVAEGVGAPLMVGATLDQVSAHIACAIVSF